MYCGGDLKLTRLKQERGVGEQIVSWETDKRAVTLETVNFNLSEGNGINKS